MLNTFWLKNLGSRARKLTEFADFLSKKGVIAYEEESRRIKIKPEWQDALLAED